MWHHQLDRDLAGIAQRQYGAFSRAQVLGAGGSDKAVSTRIAAGAWKRLDTAVYGLPSHPSTWLQQLMVAVLGHPEAHVSGRAAASLHGLRGFRNSRPEITVPRHANHRSPLAIVHETSFETKTTFRAGIPVTTVPQTICELARQMRPTALGDVLDDAVARRLTTHQAVAIHYAEWWPRGHGQLRSLVAVLNMRGDRYIPPTSELERLLYAILERPGMPRYERQARVPWHHEVNDIVDALIPGSQLIVEGDGRTWHDRVAAAANDRRRDNTATRHGYATLRYLWEQVHRDPDGVEQEIRATHDERRQ